VDSTTLSLRNSGIPQADMANLFLVFAIATVKGRPFVPDDSVVVPLPNNEDASMKFIPMAHAALVGINVAITIKE